MSTLTVHWQKSSRLTSTLDYHKSLQRTSHRKQHGPIACGLSAVSAVLAALPVHYTVFLTSRIQLDRLWLVALENVNCLKISVTLRKRKKESNAWPVLLNSFHSGWFCVWELSSQNQPILPVRDLLHVTDAVNKSKEGNIVRSRSKQIQSFVRLILF